MPSSTPSIPLRRGELLFDAYRVLCLAGFALMFFINFYSAPLAEWIDRDKAVAAVKLGLRTPVYPSPSPDGEPLGPFGDAGKKLGLKGFQLLVAVDGRPLPRDAAGRVAALSGPDGKSVTLTFQRADGSTHDEVAVRSDDYERREFAGSGLDVTKRRLASFLFDLLSRLVGLAAALILFLRRPRDPVAMLFVAAMLLNGFPVATKATMWPGLGGVLMVAVAQFSLVLTGLLFPHGRMRTPWHWLALVVALAALYKDVAANMDFWFPIEITSFVVYAGNFASLFTLLIALVADYRMTPEGVERQQFKPVAFGTGIWIAFFALGLATNLLVRPLYPTEAARAWVSIGEWACYSIAWMGLPVGLLVGLSRYRLYDADAAISRTVAYAGTTLALFVLFGVVRSILDSIGAFYFGHSPGMFQGVWSAVISAAILRPLQKSLFKWTNRRIRGGLVDLKDDLPVLIGDLRETEPTATVVDVVLEAVETGTHAQRAAIVIGGDVIGTRNVDAQVVREWLSHWTPPAAPTGKVDRDRRDLQFPVRIPLEAGGAIGWLLVGSRPDNSMPSADERAALRSIAKPVARSVAITRTREARAAEHRRTIGLLDRAVTDLQARLDRLDPGPNLRAAG